MASADQRILLLGILQSGKTSLFRRLCSVRFEDSASSGSTQSLTEGWLRSATGLRSLLPGRASRPGVKVIDTPGTATLFAQGEDESLTRDALLTDSPRALLVVMDQKNMRRSLALALHATEFFVPMVVAVNMSDEAMSQGIEVDYDLLGARLGVDVVPTVAVEDMGVARLLGSLRRPVVPNRPVRYPGRIEKALREIGAILEDLPAWSRGLGLLLLTGDRRAERIVEAGKGGEILEDVRAAVFRVQRDESLPLEVLITDVLYEEAERLVHEVVHTEPRERGWLEHLGRLAQHPLFGIPLAVLVVAAMYYWVGALGATLVVDAIDRHVFQAYLIPWADALVAPIPSALVRDAIMDQDFGLLPTGLFLAFGLLMPVILFYYFALEILHQSGYLPRLSILLDRVLRLVGLNGKGVMPLVMGFSCITMALVTTRMLETRKQRLIASFLLMLGIPCAPLLAVMLVVLADLPAGATLLVFGVIAVQIFVAGALANRFLPGLQADFVMVVPPMRVPRLRHALARTLRMTYAFMREAVPFFLVAALALFIFDRIGGLALVERLASPLMNGLLGLPDSAMHVFIKTMIRRESGAAELNLLKDGYSGVQLVVTMLVMTFLTPCVNAFIVLAKERGLRAAALIVGSVSIYSVLVGALVNAVLRLAGVTFA
ncbi:MAG: ferrous iron transporter B [Deltaproteobacteria bacterium]|nr:ferrous iron transporter B [Deltaproteobacteria bacterium]